MSAHAGAAPLRASADWYDWTWQMRNRVRTADELERFLEPTAEERAGIEQLAERFHFVITPYYASLMDPGDPACPIRRQVVPHVAELGDPAGLADPLDEVAHSPVKNVIRVYRDRIAFCVNNECALYCRFCLRKRMVGEPEWAMKKRELEVALDWIRATPEIRDVLLTGGDPLVFSDERLGWLLGELRAIPHVEIVRLGTRLPVTLPFRVTDELCRMLARSIRSGSTRTSTTRRSSRPRPRTRSRGSRTRGFRSGTRACSCAASTTTWRRCRRCAKGSCACASGPTTATRRSCSRAPRTSACRSKTGVALFRALRGRTSGFAIPQYVLDTPYGKVPLAHPYLRGREGDDVVVETYDGRIWREPNPR